MKGNLIIDGNAVYEIDMDCMEQLEKKKEKKKAENEGKHVQWSKAYEGKEKKY